MSASRNARIAIAVGMFLLGASRGTLVSAAANDTHAMAATIDGGAAIRLPILRADGRPMIDIEALAKGIGMQVARRGATLALLVNGTWVSVAADNPTVFEGGIPTMRLTTAPVKRAGKFFLAVDDITSLLDIGAFVQHDRLVIETKAETTAGNVAVSEVAVVKASPRPSAVPVSRSRFEPAADKRVVGHASLNMDSNASSRTFNALLDGGGRTVHANLFANGTSGGGAPTFGGSARFGAGDRHFTIGGVDDPLFGTIFSGGGANGFEYANGNGGILSSTVAGTGDRRVFAVGRRGGESMRELAYAGGGGSAGQFLLGMQSWHQSPQTYLRREIWLGEHGVGAGLHYRSTGRFFTEEKLGFAGAGLPLTTGDAPTQATVGYDFSNAFSVRTGFASGLGQHGAALAQITARTALAALTFSEYGRQFSTNAVFRGHAAQATIGFAHSPGMGQIDGLADFAVSGRGNVEARAYLASQNGRDLSLAYRFDRVGPSASLGLETVTSGAQAHVGPVVGYAAPVAAGLSVGVEAHPLARGNALRFSINQTLLAGARLPQRFVMVETQADLPSGTVLLVDGVRTSALATRQTKVQIPAGTHYLSLAAPGGTFASPETRVTDGIPSFVVLPLWPVAQVTGRVRIADANAFFGAPPSLAGITVVLAPSGTTAQTDEDGNFAFPSQAVDPGAVVTVDPSSLSDRFAPVSDQRLANPAQPVEFILRSAKAIERIRF